MTEKLLATQYVNVLREHVAQHADTKRAEAMSAYMRHLFPFYGIGSVPRTRLFREFVSENGMPGARERERVIKLLWQEPHREMQYIAFDVLYAQRRMLEPHHIKLAKHCITHKSWWDTVDAIAPRIAGPLYQAHTTELSDEIESWIHAKDFWLNRSAIILQLGFKERTDVELLERAIAPHVGSREFFIQKAIGWALRQYSYTRPAWVVEFVNTRSLPALSVREALKAIKRKAEHAHRSSKR